MKSLKICINNLRDFMNINIQECDWLTRLLCAGSTPKTIPTDSLYILVPQLV
jgi:hypothetical protein